VVLHLVDSARTTAPEESSVGHLARAAAQVADDQSLRAWLLLDDLRHRVVLSSVKPMKTLADGILPGWGALTIALSPLWESTELNALEATLSVCTAFTNIVFVFGFVLSCVDPPRSRSLFHGCFLSRPRWTPFGST
jgi:hypothetical protein